MSTRCDGLFVNFGNEDEAIEDASDGTSLETDCTCPAWLDCRFDGARDAFEECPRARSTLCAKLCALFLCSSAISFSRAACIGEGLLRLLLPNSDGKELLATSLPSGPVERLTGVKHLPEDGRFRQDVLVDIWL